MSFQGFPDAEELLQHLLNDLHQQRDITIREMSGKKLNMARVVHEFYEETSPPHGRTHFLRYCIVWLYNNWSAGTDCSSPSIKEYETAWTELRVYQHKPWQTKCKILECLAGFGQHLILRCIYPMMGRLGATTGDSGSIAGYLREECLRRDGNECVVAGAFNLDDDGSSLHTNPQYPNHLQVARIIPSALGWRDNADRASILPHLNAHMILDMFSPGTIGGYHRDAILIDLRTP